MSHFSPQKTSPKTSHLLHVFAARLGAASLPMNLCTTTFEAFDMAHKWHKKMHKNGKTWSCADPWLVLRKWTGPMFFFEMAEFPPKQTTTEPLIKRTRFWCYHKVLQSTRFIFFLNMKTLKLVEPGKKYPVFRWNAGWEWDTQQAGFIALYTQLRTIPYSWVQSTIDSWYPWFFFPSCRHCRVIVLNPSLVGSWCCCFPEGDPAGTTGSEKKYSNPVPVCIILWCT